MPDLIQSFDSYNDFRRNVYFTICFDSIASGLYAEISLKASKENMKEVIALIDQDSLDLEVIFKKWITEDNRDAEMSEDYVHEYLMKSESNRLVLWVSLENNFLEVHFLYDANDSKTEKWVLNTNHKLRSSLGEKKSPTFNILSKDQRSFRTEEVNLDEFEFDASVTYNDDFSEVNTIIENSFNEKSAGLILLHGEPGTGKTSYIKNLINTHREKKFIFIQNEFVKELLDPDFISFLLRHRDSVLIIEDAEKVITTREHTNENSVVSTILQLTDGLFSDYLNVKIICTFNTSIEKIDKALLRKGRMIAYYNFQALTKDKTNALLASLGREPSDQELTVAEIFNVGTKKFNQESKTKKIGF